ncbi:MAG: 16S rRNA (guanine(527)-N(7))-methyltransferase RsmG [Betaproteobacteria bacterium]
MTGSAIAPFPLLRQRLDEGLADLKLDLDPPKRAQLLQYLALLDKWNKVYNLTAVREPLRMIGLHVLDSLTLLAHLGVSSTIIDVGSGAGLPGIPLAISSPHRRVTMLDSVAKKTTFIRQALGELGLKNADVVTGRVEDYRPPVKFDRVVSRAFAELKDFVDGAGHLCADAGEMLAMKGVFPHDEIGRLPDRFIVKEVISLKVPGVDGQRHLVVIKKKN